MTIDSGIMGAPAFVETNTGDRDWFFCRLVEFANLGVELGVTLNVGGALLSGTLISGQRYFEELANQISTATGAVSEISAVISQELREYAALYADADDDDSRDEPDDPPPTVYLHLAGAQFFTPGQKPLPDGEGFLWRGKIADVSGFVPTLLSAA